ncbi:hypothetical protein J45TS6_08320 [Paenibacillus sp. J45TS6]|uniref:hypothetical protein n=1 Tax=Paenibacillus sp. J45TS6 TaxID=2807196 RepID=UPI001B078B6B|nr:hypothetical protein [Paenibacillus sp. J45TS6]GIP42373.1 hypothetical protein J45TS6_08320 [Paenibacillus sp. J45TS6]
MKSSTSVFEVTLKRAHINWGTLGSSRSHNQRSVYEAYIPIPLSEARKNNILSGSIYRGRTADGFFNTLIKASGSAGENLRYAKQFQGYRNLKLFGWWFEEISAKPGDIIQVIINLDDEIIFNRI